jgi:hypothetical protein
MAMDLFRAILDDWPAVEVSFGSISTDRACSRQVRFISDRDQRGGAASPLKNAPAIASGAVLHPADQLPPPRIIGSLDPCVRNDHGI